MGILKSVARKIIFPVVIKSGFETMLSRGAENRHLVLMYHGVVNEVKPELSVNHLSKKDFEKHLQYLKDHFEVVSLVELFKMYRNNSNDSKQYVAITFDDGYENNYNNAFPLLKKHNLPATIFVAAQCLQSNDAILWYDFIDLFKKEINLNSIDFSTVELKNEKKEKLQSIKSIGKLKSFLKTLTTEEKKSVMQRLFTDEKANVLKLKGDKEYWKMLNANQMKEMTDSGLIEIGSHSVSHPNLDCISSVDLINELRESKKLLEAAIEKEVISIAYPDGAYSDEVKKQSIDSGYKNLLAVDYRLSSDADDKNVLPRFCISNTTTVESNMISLHKSFSKSGF
ncbi:MAG: polysaccharide deacetylase family protein [Bacteroidia bacterium]